MKANEFDEALNAASQELTERGEVGAVPKAAWDKCESAIRYSEQQDHLDAIEALEEALKLIHWSAGDVKDAIGSFMAAERVRHEGRGE
jgi:hypothetical protein